MTRNMTKIKIIGGVLLAAVILLALFLWLGFRGMEGAGGGLYVATVNGEEIEPAEYHIYLREQKLTYEETGEGTDIWDTYFDGISAMAVVKQNALDSVVYVKLMVGEANRQGISLTEEEQRECVQAAKAFYAEFSDLEQQEIPYDYVEKTMMENALLQKLYEISTQDYVRDEEAFADYFDENQNQFAMLWFNYIKIPFTAFESEALASDLAQTLQEEAMTGKTLSEIYREQERESLLFHEWVDAADMEALGVVIEEPDLAAPGFVNHIYEDAGGFYLVEIVYNTIFEPETRILVGEAYDRQIAKEQFDQQYSALLRNAVVEKNSSVWDSIQFIAD